jgi:stearoyl-CoA desaturase (delta-9 desaturase)
MLLAILISLAYTVLTVFICIKYIHPRTHHGNSYHETPKTALYRFWFWFTTGLNYKEWAAVHRHNHIHAEQKWKDGKPKNRVIRSFMYNYQRSNKELVKEYGTEVPCSWLDRNIYYRFSFVGPVLNLFLLILLLGYWGILPWLVNLGWTVFLKSESVNADIIPNDNFNDFLTSLKASGKYYE